MPDLPEQDFLSCSKNQAIRQTSLICEKPKVRIMVFYLINFFRAPFLLKSSWSIRHLPDQNQAVAWSIRRLPDQNQAAAWSIRTPVFEKSTPWWTGLWLNPSAPNPPHFFFTCPFPFFMSSKLICFQNRNVIKIKM